MPHCEHLTLYRCIACGGPFCIDCDCRYYGGSQAEVEDLDRCCRRCGERRARITAFNSIENKINRHREAPPQPLFGLPVDIKAAALFMMVEGLSSEQIAIGIIQAKSRALGGDIEKAVTAARQTLMDAVHTIDAMVARVDAKADGVGSS